MATSVELEDRVGYRLGETISTTSVPTTIEVQSWLDEAAYKIVKKAKPIFLQKNILEDYNDSGDEIDVTTLTRFCKPVALAVGYTDNMLDLSECKFIPPEGFQKAARGLSAFIKGTEEFPLYTLMSDKVKWTPNDAGTWGNSGAVLVYSINDSTTIIEIDLVLIEAGDVIRIDTEIMTVTSMNGTDATVVRGAFGSIPTTHAANAEIHKDSGTVNISYLEYISYPTDAGGLDDVFDEVLVDYATMMAKLQDEELADAQVFGQLFMAEFGGGE